ncbi:MAG: Rnf-Nqr domain containing protein [Candidatus Wallacebacter cryptica]|jgi:electron transport complex protein RnfE|nr:electron transport complex subunit E [Bacillota bacterium]
MSVGKEFIKGIWSENPVFRLAVGLVPALGITHLAINGVYIGAASAVVLLASVLVKIAVSKLVSKDVGIYVDFASAAVFTTLLYRLVAAYQPELMVQLGIYFPLIAVNSFVLQRLSWKAAPAARVLDAVGMGIGYTAALTLIGIIREFVGLGQFFGVAVLKGTLAPFSLAATVPGGFVIVGLLMALFNAISGKGGEINE